MDHQTVAAKVVTDAAIIPGVASMPLWLQYVATWGQPLLVIGGFIILAMRFVVARRDLRDSTRRRR